MRIAAGRLLPRAPTASATLSQAFLAHAAAARTSLKLDQQARKGLAEAGREISDLASTALHLMQSGDPTGASRDLSAAAGLLSARLREIDTAQHAQHRGVLGTAAQAVATAQLFDAFLTTGTLGQRPVASAEWKPTPPPAVPDAMDADAGDGGGATDAAGVPAAGDAALEYEDTEYVLALISASHEIGRYATGRATAADAASVMAARDVTSALLEAMLAFDLRNGPLRRSFDSLKWVVRRLEDTLYELSQADHLAAAAAAASDAAAAAADAAAAASTGATAAEAAAEAAGGCVPLVDLTALDAARRRYEATDAAREAAIKKCRDVQKLAKQAIFSLHRSDTSRAGAQLEEACSGARALLGGVSVEAPELRQLGAVKAMVEELLEARLFAAWLASPGTILHADDEALGVDCSTEEYLGALCDLTGEIPLRRGEGDGARRAGGARRARHRLERPAVRAAAWLRLAALPREEDRRAAHGDAQAGAAAIRALAGGKNGPQDAGGGLGAAGGGRL